MKTMRYSNVTNEGKKNNYEAALVFMCISIIFGLIIRAISIVIYTVITNINNVKDKEEPVCSIIHSKEFKKSYFIAFIIGKLELTSISS